MATFHTRLTEKYKMRCLSVQAALFYKVKVDGDQVKPFTFVEQHIRGLELEGEYIMVDFK